MKPGLSLCMIVKDEERFLDACLASVAGVVDEICIVDTGSTDATLQIAARHGARVAHEPWREDFSAARNRSLEMATRPWILVLDADETLAPGSREPLRALAQQLPKELGGLWVRCRNLIDDYKGADTMSNAIVRVFPRHPRLRFRNAIHEFVALDGDPRGMPAKPSDLEIIHHGYLGQVVADRNKPERNLRLSRRAVELDPADPFHWYNLGAAASIAGEPEEAIAALERMRVLTADSPRAFRPQGLVQLATLHLDARRDPRTAEGIAREALAIADTLATAHFILGKALVHQGRLHEARDAYGAAVRCGAHAHQQFVVDDDVSLWKAQSEIGATLMSERRYALALQWFELGLANRPNVQPLMLNRAKALEALGHLDAAEAAFAEAWATFADGLSAIEYANVLLRRSDERRALAVIDAALPRASGQSALLLGGTGAALVHRRGDVHEARARLRAIVAAGARVADLELLLDQVSPATRPLLKELAPSGGEGGLGLVNDLLRARLEVRAG